ncbi:unconventional myosin-IXb isoform X4 [Rhinichthys klamathensis goyatoka]|uniref:unconventional myosin-IXb isoform X4 n=1 Tax=Rhinichthys klamathensis goyatoka TaxID=3034132 RepID=UPI0024B597BC|nr:unconventional myosin-IXb isoform X4 [Rhinichthys klamathensis goyatoka]
MSVKDGDGTTSQDGKAYDLQIYPRLARETASCCTVRVTKEATAATVIQDVAAVLGLDASKRYVLAEVKECGGEEWVLESTDIPVHRVLLWPRKAQEQHSRNEGFYFLLQERNCDGSIRYVHLPAVANEQEAKRLVARGFLPPKQEDFEDLCNLPVLSEDSILDNLRNRFQKKKIYTYAGSILVAINPFKFLPIYNPKYVKMYENHQLGKLEPHIFAIADVAYYAMLRKHVNQCIVISGESGSGKTQSTNFLIHCLTALSQKGYASGVERTILGAGPVLEAFGNAKTAHNNNSSRFGKFIQVNYLESGVVRGAVVEKYLLEKSRLVSREKNERNYHVFYYLLVGASEDERRDFKLLQPEEYFYLKQQNFVMEDADDLRHDFERLQQAMEMVGFLPATKRQIFSVLSAILYLGNVTYSQKSSGREEGLDVGPPEVLSTLSDLLKVKEELLVEALTKRKTVTVNDKLILPYSHSEAITARDSMAKSLYSALFDWIVLRINHALLNKKDMEESVSCLSIGVLDIFGFEDFETNSFEQFCINYANEQLQYYFNQHIFKLEQEEYQSEGITWHNIDYTDNVGCIHLISKKPTGLLYLLDEESNFPHATDKTLLAKFKQQHQQNQYFVATPVMEPAFVILHFAGKVKYQIKDFREKNTDHMRPDIVALLRSSDRAYVRQLIGMDPVAMFRWGILRASVRALAAFNEAGRRWAAKTAGVVRPNSRVPLGELQRSNVPIERMYRHAPMLDFSFDHSEERPLEAFEDIFSSYESKKKSKNTKTKQLIPKSLLDSRSLKFIVGLHDRTTKSLLHLHKKKRPPSISAQFQTSLSKLLETLGKAEPFFIRCLRSNAEKREMCFDEALIVQQLRYTGMLETVRIRRSGYGAKYTFQEFTEQFRVLLPKNATSLEEISSLLHKLGFDHTTYQIGRTKVYLKELERQKLQDILHKDVMHKMIFLQRWFSGKIERMDFIRMREAAIVIQRSWRRFRKEKFYQAVVLIQTAWRGSKQRAEYRKTRASITKIQALARGQSARKRYYFLKEEKRKREEEEARRRKEEEEAAARRAKEAEEAVRRAKEVEAAARRLKEEEEAARKAREEEEAARRQKEEREARFALEAERQEKTSLQQPTVPTSGKQPGDEKTLVLEHKTAPVDVEIEGKAHVVDVSVPKKQNHSEKIPQVEAGPPLEVKEQQKQTEKESSALPRDERTPMSPETPTGQIQNRAPQLSKLPVSRSQEKRELRRQRGLEHSQRESERAASAWKDDTPFKSKTLESPGKAEGKLKERSDSKELDQYTFVAWKGEKSKRDAKDVPPELVRPSTLPLDIPTSGPGRNGYSDPAIAAQPPLAKEEANRRKEPSRSNTQPENLMAGPRSLEERNIKSLQNRGISMSLDDVSKIGSGGSSQGKARPRRRPRLALARICMPIKSVEIEDAEYWAVPLPPMSPFETQSSTGAGPDRTKANTLKEKVHDSHSLQEVSPLQPSTPERTTGFFRKILKKRPHKEAQTPEDGDLSMASFLDQREATSPSRSQNSKTHPGRLGRTPSIMISHSTTRASEQWNASLNRVITNTNELRNLDEFLGNQVNDLRSRGKQLSGTEHIFITATVQFRENIKGMYSISKSQIGYKALMNCYQNKVISLAGEKQKGEVPLVVNLFQSVLDGFIRAEIKKEEAEPAKPPKGRKMRRKKAKSLENPLDHVFTNYQVNIIQSCDQCTSYIWGMEKAYMCSYCKMVCHKKCISKIVIDCSTFGSKKCDDESGSQHFGVRVCHLVNSKTPVPVVLEIMMEHVEMNGLYTEGIYRKSGSANRMKELHQLLEAGPENVCLEDYPIHAVTGLVKQWLRELPEPLLTFTHYNDFLRAIELPEKLEQLQAIYKVLEQLPTANFSTLERLIFHLVRVAKEEKSNRMTPNSLAIVFAPCILRCPDSADPLMSMKDVAKTTTCVELILQEQIRRYNDKMEEIEQLEYAQALAVNQLKLKRQNTCWHLPLRFITPYKEVAVREKPASDLRVVPENEPLDSDAEAERSLMERIKSIKQEKEDLACRLPELDQPGSDQENLDSEASVSSESLLDERAVCSDTEGQPMIVPRLSKAACLPKSVVLAQGGSTRADGSSLPSLSSPRLQLQRRHPIIPGTVKLPPGVLCHPAVRSLPPRKSLSLTLFQRRENPGRRKDSIQSLYITAGADLLFPSSTESSDASSTQELQTSSRRFSDPDLAFVNDTV